LLSHLRRWRDRKLIATCFVEFNGKPAASVKKPFKTAKASWAGGQSYPTHLAPHRRDLANAARRTDLGGGRVPGMSPEVLQST